MGRKLNKSETDGGPDEEASPGCGRSLCILRLLSGQATCVTRKCVVDPHLHPLEMRFFLTGHSSFSSVKELMMRIDFKSAFSPFDEASAYQDSFSISVALRFVSDETLISRTLSSLKRHCSFCSNSEAMLLFSPSFPQSDAECKSLILPTQTKLKSR